MKYIGFDLGDGESAISVLERSGIEPVVQSIGGSKSVLSAVGMHEGNIVIGEEAYANGLADDLRVRFKSRFTTDISSSEDITRFAKGVLANLDPELTNNKETRFVIGCPAGWNAQCRHRYSELLCKAGITNLQIISESRAAFLYAKYAKTIALDIDLFEKSALVVDIGSSTLDYAFIVDGREIGIGTFGENALGGGLLDAALLRRCAQNSSDADAIFNVWKESRSWYSYCEIEARRVKEAYYSRLLTEDAPSVHKNIRICYDGIQRLSLYLDAEEAEHLIDDPLPELGGISFRQAIADSLENAKRLTSDHEPSLLLLTGGASRMPFFRESCAEVFPDAVIVCCPEPEFSIAKGLAYAGWVDDNVSAFRRAVQTELSEDKISSIANDLLSPYLSETAEKLTSLLIEQAAVPAAIKWKHAQIDTLKEMETAINEQARKLFHSDLAREALQPVLEKWTSDVSDTLQSLIDPICDRYDIPRKRMLLAASTAGTDVLLFGNSVWSGLEGMRTILSVTLSAVGGLLCGGSGIALISAGPVGLLAGLVIGAVASLLGWGPISSVLMNTRFPRIMRLSPIEKRVSDPQTRKKVQNQLLTAISDESSDFRQKLVNGTASAFHTYLIELAQAAEIPIE